MACECAQWSAVHDHQGPSPATLRVQGRCKVSEIPTEVTLRVHEPPPANDDDLLLDLVYTPPGLGLPTTSEVDVMFELVTDTEYTTVSIVDCELGIKVEDLQ